MNKLVISLFVTSILIISCSSSEDNNSSPSLSDKKVKAEFSFPDINIKHPQTQRWYTQQQVINGEKTFGQICAACHKKDASGTKNWQESNNGVFPPPPLNGQAHTWHHPLAQLHSTIKDGTSSLGGNMPAWGKILNDEKILETIAFFQSKWSEEIYETWLTRNTK